MSLLWNSCHLLTVSSYEVKNKTHTSVTQWQGFWFHPQDRSKISLKQVNICSAHNFRGVCPRLLSPHCFHLRFFLFLFIISIQSNWFHCGIWTCIYYYKKESHYRAQAGLKPIIFCLGFLIAGIKDICICSQDSHCSWACGEAVHCGMEESSWQPRNRKTERERPFSPWTLTHPVSCHQALAPRVSVISQWSHKWQPNCLEWVFVRYLIPKP